MLEPDGLQQLGGSVQGAEPDADEDVPAVERPHGSVEDERHRDRGDREPDGEEVRARDDPDEVSDEEERRPPDGGDGDEQAGRCELAAAPLVGPGPPSHIDRRSRSTRRTYRRVSG